MIGSVSNGCNSTLHFCTTLERKVQVDLPAQDLPEGNKNMTTYLNMIGGENMYIRLGTVSIVAENIALTIFVIYMVLFSLLDNK